MLSWFRKKDQIAAFWAWFETNAKAIKRGVEQEDHSLIVHELGRRLSKVHPSVCHEIGMPDDETVELIISADGMREALPFVLALAYEAPRLDGFLFTAFRPRRPVPELGILDRRVVSEDVRYISEADGDRLHLRIFLRGDWSEKERLMVGFLMLDQALGEYDVMTGLGTIDFDNAAPPITARPLSDLAPEFDTLRGATAH